VIFSYTEFLQLLGLYFYPFIRIGAMMAFVPLYGSAYISPQSKIMLVLLITLVVAPTLALPPPVNPFTWHGILLIMQQVGIGLAMGLIFAIVFEAFVIAGHLVSMSMGLAMASMIDPGTGVNSPVIGRYYMIIVTLIFLLLNGHVLVFKVVVDSFEYLPVGLFYFDQVSLKSIVLFGGKMFEAGVMVALPIVTALLLVNIALGVISRAAPALNIFAIGFGITILSGIIMLIIVTPLILPVLQNLIIEALDVLHDLRLNE